jgi:protein gp37
VKSTSKGPRWTNKSIFVENILDAPRRWKIPKVIFVNSMADLFHKNITDEQIKRVFTVMVETNRHTYQVLTKQSKRLADLGNQLSWGDNIWMGVSVENSDYLDRTDDLRMVPAKHRFISAEPLLGPLGQFDLSGIEWVIAGGESGPGARPSRADWYREIRDQCVENDVMFHFKQWGGVRKSKYGRILDGRTHDDMPVTDDNSILKNAA